MRPQLWKIYDKKGSNLNLMGDSYINMKFTSNLGVGAAGYAITDPSAFIVDTFISNGGKDYTTSDSIQLEYTFSTDGQPIDVDTSIFVADVSVFDPEGRNAQSVTAVTIDSSAEWIYPAVTFAGALFLDPVSQGLIETEHLTIFEDDPSIGYVTPHDTSNGLLVFRMSGDETQISLFTLNEYTQEILWTDEIIYDVSSYVVGGSLQLNIGFRSNVEGVFERRLMAYHRVGGVDYPLVELVINAQSIGKDERLNTLLDNFGLYHPDSFPQLFKEVDINEDLPDWEILNYKAKHMILEHDHIMPFIGTYKGLINAIKWLGYEDIKVKEWFRDVKEGRNLSLYVPYDADGRKRTITYFSDEERRNLQKLNQLSLVYCINRETGEVDEWGNPETENCYEYNLNEILIKLYALKQWLEKNIIGVNARIWDLTGEGIYLERFQNFLYGTQNIGSDANYVQSLTPQTINPNSELVTGDASILLTLKEYENVTIEDLPFRVIDFARYGWDPSNGFFSPDEYYDLSYVDPSAVFIGSPFAVPWVDLYDIQWKMTVDKEYAGVVTTQFATNPLLIRDNEIKFYNYFDTSTLFLDVSANIDVTIEKGTLRDPSIDIWEDSIAYSIYPNFYIYMDSSTYKTFTYDGSYAVLDGSGTIYNDTSVYTYNATTLNPVYFLVDGSVFIGGDASTIIQSPIQNGYTLESSTGELWQFPSEFSLQTSTSPKLMYAFDDNYLAPLLSIEGYKWSYQSSFYDLERNYFLDIEDGKIRMIDDAAKEIIVNGLLDFDGINDSVRVYPQPDISGEKTISFDIFFESYTATTDVFIIFSCGADNTDYLMISYRPAVEQLFVAAKRTNGMSSYDISHLIDQHVVIEIQKETGNISSVKANGEELSVISSGLTGPFATSETYFGYHPAYVPSPWKYLNHALIWDLEIKDQNHWAGYPNGNTNTAWIDTISGFDGTVLGSPTTIDSSYLNPNYGSSEVDYINFNYDTSLDEQKISLVVSYTSPRMPIFTYDPSDASTLYYTGGDASSIVLIDDNSIYKMDVNHAGNYEIEIYGWNGQNNLFFNFDRDGYDVWQKFPTINAYIDTSCARNIVMSCTSTYLAPLEVRSIIDLYPIFDRIIPLQGLSLEYDTQGMPYLNIPSITYFQDLPDAGSISRYYNMTERITDISGTTITIDKDFQSFYTGDEINIVQFDKGDYSFIQEVSASIISGTYPSFVIDNSIGGTMAIDPSTMWYALNGTERAVSNGVNNLGLQTFTCDISNYTFEENQLVAILIEDPSGNQWGSSFRVLDSSTTLDPSYGYLHTFKGNVPEFTLDTAYTLTAKHAFSTYADFSIDVASATEVGNDFHVYLDDVYYHQYYLDNTFVFLSINFDQDRVLQQWFDPNEQVEALTNWTNHGFSLFVTDGTEIEFAVNGVGGDPSDYCQSNTFNVVGGTTIDISINYYNGGGLPRPAIPKFYIQEIGGDDPSTEYTIVKDQGYWYQNNFVHALDSSTTSAYLRFYDGSTGADMNFKAGTSVLKTGLSEYYYPFDHSIELDISTFVILRAEYDPSNYMLNQKNIWTITNADTDELIMQVWNDTVSYIFDEAGEYDVQVESYDSFGNLKTQLFEGLIKINDE